MSGSSSAQTDCSSGTVAPLEKQEAPPLVCPDIEVGGGGQGRPGGDAGAGAGGGALPRTGFDPGVLLLLGGAVSLSGVLLLRYAR